MDLKEINNQICDALQREASIKRAKEEARIQAYYEGVIDTSEAFRRRMSEAIIIEANKEEKQP